MSSPVGQPLLSDGLFEAVLQMVEVIDPRQRDRRLPELLKQYHGAKRQNRIIVFVL